MTRGLKFEVPNKWFPVINIILNNIDIKKYFWFIVEENVIGDFFKRDRYPGTEFEKIIDGHYYAILLNLQAYNNEDNFSEIENYEDYIESKCELVLFINDNSYVDIYAKDKGIIEIIKKNAENNEFKNIRYITDENDTRKEFFA